MKFQTMVELEVVIKWFMVEALDIISNQVK